MLSRTVDRGLTCFTSFVGITRVEFAKDDEGYLTLVAYPCHQDGNASDNSRNPQQQAQHTSTASSQPSPYNDSRSGAASPISADEDDADSISDSDSECITAAQPRQR